jgi:tetratricopeptide (TPR) repeat protein
LVQIDQLDGWDTFTLDYLALGPSLIEQGDLQGYEEFRRAAVARFTGATYRVMDRIVKISLLLPADKQFMNSLLPLAEAARNSFTNETEGDVFQSAWRSLSLALLEYRRGDYTKAVEWCQRCLGYAEHNAPRTATAKVILAMAYYQLGRTDEARAQLTEARETIEDRFRTGLDRGSGVQGFWFDWAFGRILLREATSLINASPGASGQAVGTR